MFLVPEIPIAITLEFYAQFPIPLMTRIFSERSRETEWASRVPGVSMLGIGTWGLGREVAASSVLGLVANARGQSVDPARFDEGDEGFILTPEIGTVA